MIDTTILLLILLVTIAGFSIVINLIRINNHWKDYEQRSYPSGKRGASGHRKPKESRNAFYNNMNRAYRRMYGSEDE